MKKFLFILFISIGFALAQPGEDYGSGYWIKSYYAQAGANVTYTNGDLNERALSIKDSNGKAMKVYPPDVSILFAPEIQLGVDIRFFSLGVTFQYTAFDEDLVKNYEDVSSDVTFWRLGLEFVYNLNWPEDFQVGLGLGYNFLTLKASESAYDAHDSYRSEFMGLGLGAVANVHYYFTSRIAIVPAIRVYENWYKNLYTKPSGSLELDPYLWQTIVSASVALQVKF